MSSSESKRNECTKKEISGQITPIFSPAGGCVGKLPSRAMYDRRRKALLFIEHTSYFQPRARVAVASC